MAGIIAAMNSFKMLEGRGRARLTLLLRALRNWPWFETLQTLRQRFREDRLGMTAGSLTFTTLITLVPLLAVMLAVFTAFPMFGKFQDALQKYFLQALIPDTIAKPVLAALTQFASKASRVGTAGLVVLAASVLSLMFTIDRALNAIWRVRSPRPMTQRVLIYWAGLTLGPLLLGISLSLTSYALSASKGLVSAMPGGITVLLEITEFLLLAACMAGLFHYVPHTHVRWRHAWAGGLFVATAFELAKRGLTFYVGSVGSFSTIYGAFATLPIFLLWLYLSWVIVLLGAVVAAYAPSLRLRVERHPGTPGYRFTLALAVLAELAQVKDSGPRGLDLEALAQRIQVDPLQIEPVVEALVALDWVGRLDEGEQSRHVLLCDPVATPATPLVDMMLLAPHHRVQAFRCQTQLERLSLSDLLHD